MQAINSTPPKLDYEPNQADCDYIQRIAGNGMWWYSGLRENLERLTFSGIVMVDMLRDTPFKDQYNLVRPSRFRRCTRKGSIVT